MERDAPKTIKFDSIVEDIAFHPHKDVIAAGLIEGNIVLHSYSITEENHLLVSLKPHKKACRGLEFSPDGELLFSVSKDRSLQTIDMTAGVVKHAIPKAHKSAIYSVLPVDQNIVVSGDDDGTLKVWDMRGQKTVMEVKESEEFISDMALEKNNRLLLATSGEGTLTAYDIRKHKMKMQSELFDSELLSLAIMKNRQKVVCGSGEGPLNIFNWGEWGNMSDRFPGHPMSVDCMLAVSDDIVVTGSLDGIIRAVHILPNQFLGVVGDHDDFPVENLSLSRCRNLLASCSHDQTIKFWNIADVHEAKAETNTKSKHKTNKNKILKKKGPRNDFFADLVEPEEEDKNEGKSDVDSDSDGDDSDEDSEEEVPKKKHKLSMNSASTSSGGDKGEGKSAECTSIDSGAAVSRNGLKPISNKMSKDFDGAEDSDEEEAEAEAGLEGEDSDLESDLDSEDVSSHLDNGDNIGDDDEGSSSDHDTGDDNDNDDVPPP